MGATSFPSSAIISVENGKVIARLTAGEGKAEEVTLSQLLNALPTSEPATAGEAWLDNGVVKVFQGTAPTITAQPSDVTANPGQTATFSVTSSNAASYQWQLDSGGGFSDISGANSSSYTTGNITISDDGNQYRCVLTHSDGGTTTSNTATLTDLYGTINSKAYFDPNYSTYQETSGSVGGLTPAGVGDSVGTWVDRSGTYVVRAPSDAKRPTLRATASGARYFEKTALTQYWISDDAASVWKFMHDGTTFCCAAEFQPATNDPDVLFPVVATYNGSYASIGFSMWYDNRSSLSRSHTHLATVARGVALEPSVDGIIHPGVAGGRWQRFVTQMDPDNATASDRISYYSFGRLAEENTYTYAPSSSNPTATLHIGALSSEAASASYGLGYIGAVILYQGAWTSTERQHIENCLDLGSADAYEVLSAAANISGQATAYEAFPTLYELGNSNLLATWRSGTSHIGDKGTITTGISADGGSTWSLTANAITHATYDVRDAHGLVLPDGTVLLGSDLYDTGTSAHQGFQVSRSTDNGESFSVISTVSIPSGYDWLFPFGRWYRLSGGTIIAPIYTRRTADGVHISELWESADDGVTWSQRSVIGEGIDETAIINLSGSNWLAIGREQTGGTVHYNTSSDDGATWGSFTDSNLEGVSPHLFQVGDTVYCAVGDRTSPGGIRVMVWSDGLLHGTGKSWLVFEAAAANTDEGYPSCVIDGQDVSMVCFDENAADPGIFFQRFTMPDFGSVL